MNTPTPTPSAEAMALLKAIAKAHEQNAKFYHEMKDRTHDTVLIAVEVMHRDSARIIQNAIAQSGGQET
jgi:hypothetical protein